MMEEYRSSHFGDIIKAADYVANRETRSISMEFFKVELEEISKEYVIGKKCIWCLRDLTGRRRSYCCDDHARRITATLYWNVLRDHIISERNICEVCGLERDFPILNEGESYRIKNIGYIHHGIEYYSIHYSDKGMGKVLWTVHHKQPINANGGGGSMFDPDNLMMVCHTCHWKLHRELNEEHRPRPEEKLRGQGYTLLDDYVGVK